MTSESLIQVRAHVFTVRFSDDQFCAPHGLFHRNWRKMPRLWWDSGWSSVSGYKRWEIRSVSFLKKKKTTFLFQWRSRLMCNEIPHFVTCFLKYTDGGQHDLYDLNQINCIHVCKYHFIYTQMRIPLVLILPAGVERVPAPVDSYCMAQFPGTFFH